MNAGKKRKVNECREGKKRKVNAGKGRRGR